MIYSTHFFWLLLIQFMALIGMIYVPSENIHEIATLVSIGLPYLICIYAFGARVVTWHSIKWSEYFKLLAIFICNLIIGGRVYWNIHSVYMAAALLGLFCVLVVHIFKPKNKV